MKSYLSLVPISAKVRKRQNRMTILCIVISVLLVTAIFSIADMFIRTESSGLQEKHGNWHIQLADVSQDVGEEIGHRSDVKAVGWAESFNFDAEQPYYIGEKKAALYGVDDVYLTQLVDALEEGNAPQNDHEVMLSSNAELALDVQIGDVVTVQTPAGDVDFTISGFGSDDSEYYRGQTYLVAVYMTRTAFTSLTEQNGIKSNPTCYIQFESASKAADAITEFEQQYHLSAENISENTAIMGLSGQSSNESVKNVYGIAAILFVLVLLAGVLMISGSMNSNVAQRTRFFGMMRCIGASRKQVIRYVRLEALNWCKTAVPIGVISGVAISFGVCAMLHYGIGGEFATMPVFALSPIGIICGVLVGIVTVLLAAQSPAKRAARVSPMAAVAGNETSALTVHHTSKLSFGKIERTLGVHHATNSKRNWFLMTASFSLSIILMLCFSVGLDFARGLVPSLQSWYPDITLNGYANTLVLEQDVFDEISTISGVESVFGSSYMDHVPATSSREGIDHVNLASYSGFLLDSAADSVMEGDISAIYGDTNQVMTISNKDNPLKVGDTIQIDGKEVEITCSVSSGVWSSEYSVICSQETFEWLTGEKNYTMIGVSLDKNATDDTIRQINNLAGSDVIFTDMRESNQENAATFWATQIVVYSFLAIIALITLFNIINSISMSVTARIKQYGAMRAVGMDGNQLTRMIAAEAFTYAFSGLIVGCGVGLLLNRFLWVNLLTRYFGAQWNVPVILLIIVVVFCFVAAVAAIHSPAKRIRNMAITETINEL